MSITPRDSVRLVLYETDGVTRLGWLSKARNITWQEVNNQPGQGSFEVPLDDAMTPLLTGRRIVRMTWYHGGVPIGKFAIRLQNEKVQLATDGKKWIRFENQPGLLSVLGNAVIMPEAGLQTDSGPTRYLGCMSTPGPWKIPTDWGVPRGRRWADTTGGFRDRRPHEFRGFDPDAMWLSLYDPDVSQPPGTYNYFLRTITFAEPMHVEMLYAADNYPHVFIDDDLLASWGPPGLNEWTQGHILQHHFEAGDHIIAVPVKNSRAVTDPNPIAFIMSARQIDAKGKPVDGTILFRTDTDNWTVHADAPDPGWHRAQGLWTLAHEAIDRGVAGIIHVGFAFGNKRGSHGEAWTDRGQFAFPATRTSLLEATRQLTESDMNVWMRPWSMKLCAAKRRGKDRSGSVAYLLGEDGGTLMTMESANRTARYNTLIGRHNDGSYVVVKDDDSIAGINRIEAGLSLGSAGSDHTAERIMQHHIDLNSTPKAQGTAQASVLDPTQPIPYLDFQVGDTITIPGRRGGDPMKSRVLSITVDATGETVHAWPTFHEDTSV